MKTISGQSMKKISLLQSQPEVLPQGNESEPFELILRIKIPTVPNHSCIIPLPIFSSYLQYFLLLLHHVPTTFPPLHFSLVPHFAFNPSPSSIPLSHLLPILLPPTISFPFPSGSSIALTSPPLHPTRSVPHSTFSPFHLPSPPFPLLSLIHDGSGVSDATEVIR